MNQKMEVTILLNTARVLYACCWIVEGAAIVQAVDALVSGRVILVMFYSLLIVTFGLLGMFVERKVDAFKGFPRG